MAARFIGVQLEIESPRPLGHLFHSFSGAEVVSVDYRESARGFAAAFEHAGTGVSTAPDIQIADLCDTILDFGGDATPAPRRPRCRTTGSRTRRS